jgi:hypothetical protein
VSNPTTNTVGAFAVSVPPAYANEIGVYNLTSASGYGISCDNVSNTGEQNCGLLGQLQARNDISPYPGILAFGAQRFFEQGNRVVICSERPSIVQPYVITSSSSVANFDTLFNAWKQKTFSGGYDFKAINKTSRTFLYNILMNSSLTAEADFPQVANFMSNAIFRLISPNVDGTFTTTHNIRRAVVLDVRSMLCMWLNS